MALVTILAAAPACVVRELPPFPVVEGELQARVELALGYLRAGQEERARRHLQRLARDYPAAAAVDDAFGVLHLSRQEWPQAERFLRAALGKDRGYAPARNNYAALLFHLGRYDEAAQQLRRALKEQPYGRQALVHSNLGRVLLRLGSHAEAHHSLKRALALDANHAPSWLVLAELYLEEGRYPQARDALERHFELATPGAGALRLGVRVARALGDWQALAKYHRRLHALGEETETAAPGAASLIEGLPPGGVLH